MNKRMKLIDVPFINEQTPRRKFENEFILVNVKDENIIYLNESAVEILELINSKNSIKDIIDKFIQIYDVDFEKAEKDIKKIIKTLIKQKIVSIK